jgi:hypothetical protein
MNFRVISLTPLNERGPESPTLPIIYLQASSGTSSSTGADAAPEGYLDHVIMGRNRFTSIQDVSLSRKVCRITVEASSSSSSNGAHQVSPSSQRQSGGQSTQQSSPDDFKLKLQMLKKTGDHFVTLNGELVTMGTGASTFVELKDGDVLGLQQHKLLYRISTAACSAVGARSTTEGSPANHTPSNDEMKSANAAIGGDQAGKTMSALQRQAHDQIREEMMCSICIEIMVCATALQPCGHMFCKNCTLPLEKCPTCRRNLYGRMPMKQVDGMILNHVKIGKTFEYDDSCHFVQCTGVPISQFEVCMATSTHYRCDFKFVPECF